SVTRGQTEIGVVRLEALRVGMPESVRRRGVWRDAQRKAVQRGGRFSAKAVMPSRASSDANDRAERSAISTKATSIDSLGTSRTRRLQAASASGAPLSRLVTYRPTVSSRLPSGATAVRSWYAAAARASNASPVRHSSIARVAPILGTSTTEIV